MVGRNEVSDAVHTRSSASPARLLRGGIALLLLILGTGLVALIYPWLVYYGVIG
jgi:hypothetical protein